MATDFTEETAADAVIESFGAQTDPRLREILTALVRHLHAFARDVELTIPEWEKAIDFLTRVGHKSDDERQEFILLSDVLGLSMLIETISNRKFGVATESTVLGPFHVVESPVRDLGDDIDLVKDPGATPCVVTGRVVSVDGTPLPHARIDVWQANDQGFYDVQQPGVQPRANGRGLFTAGEDGTFWFRTIVPSYYPIPTDGPVGELLLATGRHAFRPAHIHFIVTAPGHRALTTHIFVAGSEYIESDTVFAVKQSLVVDFEEVTDEAPGGQVERRPGAVPARQLRHRAAAGILTAPRGKPCRAKRTSPTSPHWPRSRDWTWLATLGGRKPRPIASAPLKRRQPRDQPERGIQAEFDAVGAHGYRPVPTKPGESPAPDVEPGGEHRRRGSSAFAGHGFSARREPAPSDNGGEHATGKVHRGETLPDERYGATSAGQLGGQGGADDGGGEGEAGLLQPPGQHPGAGQQLRRRLAKAEPQQRGGNPQPPQVGPVAGVQQRRRQLVVGDRVGRGQVVRAAAAVRARTVEQEADRADLVRQRDPAHRLVAVTEPGQQAEPGRRRATSPAPPPPEPRTRPLRRCATRIPAWRAGSAAASQSCYQAGQERLARRGVFGDLPAAGVAVPADGRGGDQRRRARLGRRERGGQAPGGEDPAGPDLRLVGGRPAVIADPAPARCTTASTPRQRRVARVGRPRVPAHLVEWLGSPPRGGRLTSRTT